MEDDEPKAPLEPKWLLPIEPREVQLEALQKGFGKDGFAYFLRQRLGKTWLSYAEFVALREAGECDWFFLICPNSLKEQWYQAIEQVDEYTPIHIYNSYKKYQTTQFFEQNKMGGVFIINYESMQSFMDSEGWMNLHLLRAYVVADESTKIKEPNAKMTKACHALSKMCRYKRILTGKPSANSNADFWSQLQFIGATERNFHQHKYYFCAFGGYQGRQVVRNINTKILQEEMQPVSYIAPDKYLRGFRKVYEPLRRVHLRGEQLEQYKEMENSLITELADGTQITAPIALVRYLRLQQISSGVAGDPDGTQHNLVAPNANPRIRLVLDILDNEIDKKVIIVCRFRLSVSNLETVLNKAGYKTVKLVGGMGKELEENKARFNNGEVDILIAQLQVLSFGHTLCGNKEKPCDSMIFYENDFSLINRAQCESRPENADWDVPISYYDMYASKMDKYIMESLRRKEEASLAIMGYAREYGVRPKWEEKEDQGPKIEISKPDGFTDWSPEEDDNEEDE